MKSPLLPLVALLAFSVSTTAQTASKSHVNPFGVGADNYTSQHWGEWLPQMSSLGLTEIRCLRCTWPDVEPEEGKWTWDRLDKQLADAEAAHVDFTGIFMYTPRWDTKDKPGGFPMNNLEGWSRYVTETVKHINGRAHYFEVWNEPPNGTHGAPASDYAKLVVATYDAAKAADPNCKIGLAAQSVNVNYLDQAIEAGAKDHFDYITVHPYEVLGGVKSGEEPLYMNIVPVIHEMLLAQDPARYDVPIWFSELGAEVSDKISPAQQADTLVKAYTMGIAQGVECMQWFECKDGDSGKMGLLEKDGTPRPAYRALQTMANILGPHPEYLGWLHLNEKDYAFFFRGAKETVMIAWAPPGKTDEFIFKQPVKILQPLTGETAQTNRQTLTNSPIIAVDVPQGLLDLAHFNTSSRIPWGGGGTANSVWVKMGSKNEERGLHTKSGDVVAGDVTVYGGAARSGDVPGGNVFAVDPSFLTYRTVPIEITVVVRRNPANDNAGFGLKYESTSGWKGAGWYTVPDNKEWHTKTWRIDDAQFVGKWGFNFSLDSDGNQYNKYYIQSVTVTKLAK